MFSLIAMIFFSLLLLSIISGMLKMETKKNQCYVGKLIFFSTRIVLLVNNFNNACYLIIKASPIIPTIKRIFNFNVCDCYCYTSINFYTNKYYTHKLKSYWTNIFCIYVKHTCLYLMVRLLLFKSSIIIYR